MPETMRIMAAAPRFGAPGDVAQNLAAVLERVAEARRAGARALVLPELCLSSSGCGDLFFHGLLTQACEKALAEIAHACGDVVCAVGLPLRTRKGMHNVAAVIADGNVAAFVVKQRLDAMQRGIFTADFPKTIEWNGNHAPCTEKADISPASGARIIVTFWDDIHGAFLPPPGSVTLSLSAFPTLAGGMAYQSERAASFTTRDTVIALANAGANESTTDEVFGGEAVIARGGRILSCADSFSGQAAFCDDAFHGKAFIPAHTCSPSLKEPYMPPDSPSRIRWCRDCAEIPSQALAARMRRIGAKAVTVGISGGLDSALALLVIRRAFELQDLPRESIFAYSLPGMGTGNRTRHNARRLMEAVGVVPREIDIRDSVLAHFRDIDHPSDLADAAFENAQARERTQVLMDLANMHGGLMVGTGDLSELALGFTTFGGDHLSMYCVCCGLYKSAVRHAARQAAADAGEGALRDTLLDILDTPVSPELLPGAPEEMAQQTERIVGPYALNDFFLHHFLANQAEPEELLSLAQRAFVDTYTKDELLERLRAFIARFFAAQFKRNCMPDGPRVLSVSLSPRGRFAMPSDASAALWLNALHSPR